MILHRTLTAAFLAGGVLLSALGGCGFHPLYGQSAGNPATVGELSSVRIDPLPNRDGQLLHNALLARINPRGEPDKPAYRLVIDYTVNETQTALLKDNTATRDNYEYLVRYELLQDTTPVTAGRFSRQFSYDYRMQYYSIISAKEDIRRRAADAVAEEVRNQLAAYFTRRAQMLQQPAGSTADKP